jgi:diguanylate cyclase (GGDEF)-like protein
MKKFNIYKIIQFILFAVLMAASLYMVLASPELSALLAANKPLRTVCILLWGSLGLSLLFTMTDFVFFASSRNRRKMGFSMFFDPVAGIANRHGCDVLIEKYWDKPLPKNIGCIMFELTNLKEINQTYGHLQGNKMIHDFSSFLQEASLDLCFVGRNGGNKFIAVFEICDYEKIKTFLDHLDTSVNEHNKMPDIHPIRFHFGIAFDEGSKVRTITDLIALADKRIYNT